jgi:hypothetical protein
MRPMTLLLSVVLMTTAGLAQSTPSQNPAQSAPSYDDTVHYLQERLEGSLVATGHCSFTYNNLSFFVPHLAPRVSWYEQGYGKYGRLECLNGAKCITRDWHERETAAAKCLLSVKGDANLSRVEKAWSHLIDLCGGGAAKPEDLF